MVANSVLDLIGNTPLIRLKDASEMTGCEILGKAEFLNVLLIVELFLIPLHYGQRKIQYGSFHPCKCG